MIDNWSGALKAAEHAARLAGEALRERGNAFDGVVSADGRDIKLKADRAAEVLILNSLEKEWPAPVLSEESGWSTAPTEVVWVVDPLDGSANYNRRLPLCSVSIALVHNMKPLLGVVYDVNHDELYAGAVGYGSTLNGIEVRVSDIGNTRGAILMTGLPLKRDFSRDALADFAADFAQWKKVRMIGSAATSLALVGAGKADRYAEDGIQFWDVAAGLAIVEAAGGRIQVEGDPLSGPINVTADNGRLE